jgi:hypothetical protein
VTRLTRTAFESADGVARLAVLCRACATELVEKLTLAGTRYWVREFGDHDGNCELCSHELSREVGMAET